MRVLLLYPRLQFRQGDVVKPDGSLSLPYLAGELRRRGHEVRIFDCSVGRYGEGFLIRQRQPNGLMRVGVTDSSILQEAAWADLVGITSIFTQQTTPVLEIVRLIKTQTDKLIVAGGVNARFLWRRFADAGVTLICPTEGERWIGDFCDNERTYDHPPVQDLDELAFPAWDLLPNNAYWKIARPHGGDFKPGDGPIRYASMMTSRGCPFACYYCHISKETEGSPSGNIGAYRVKSVGRVLQEAAILRDLGAEWVFLEDDSLLAKKRRACDIFTGFKGMGLRLADVNGVNLAHLVVPGGAPDADLMREMRDAGFEKLTLPFESANQRIIDKWASKKWRADKLDHVGIVRAASDLGMATFGNYMIGYPDETMDEIEATLDMAREHVANGLTAASFFVTVPFPGSAMFDMAVKRGDISEDFDPDAMSWTRCLFKGPVDATVVEAVRRVAWRLVNSPAFTSSRREMSVPA